jgi:hypothetical protein
VSWNSSETTSAVRWIALSHSTLALQRGNGLAHSFAIRCTGRRPSLQRLILRFWVYLRDSILELKKEPKVETHSADLIVDQKLAVRYEGRSGGKRCRRSSERHTRDLATELMAL